MKNFVTSFAMGKSGGGANVGTSLETIEKGDILVINYETGAVLTGAGNTVDNAPVIAIASCIEDGVPILSGPIFGKALQSGGTNPYVAPAYTRKGFGYTSVNTDGELPSGLTKAEVFNFAVVLKTDLRLVPNRQDRYDYSVLSKGGYDLALKSKMSINSLSDYNPRLAGQELFYADVVSDGTETPIDATAAVTRGSRKVTFGAVHGLSAGDYVNFPDSGLFKVAVVDSTTVITLDAPYHAATETLLAEVANSVAVDGDTKFGVEIQANEIKRTNPVDKYNQIDFDIALSENFEGAPSVITAYKPGMGTGWQVRDKEVACMGNFGYSDRRDPMRAEFPFQSDISKEYVTTELASLAPVRGDLQQSFEGPQAVFIAFDNAAATQASAVRVILTPWAASGGITV